MGIFRKTVVITGFSLVAAFAAGPEVSFGGYLDADVWGNMKGSYYTNSELDLGMTATFSDKLSAHVYATVWSANGETAGSIPAGIGLPEERWLSLLFDGFDLTYTSTFGEVTVGDLVYQYGKFNYYYYKRLSMITNECFTRGLKYSVGNDVVTQEFTLGIADRNGSTADIQGATNITLAGSASLGLYYGIKNDALKDFHSGTDGFAGAEFKGNIGDMLSMKADVGYAGIASDNSISGGKRADVYSILLEPVLTINKFSAAFTAFAMFDGDDDSNSASLFKLYDEMFFYLEPGYVFTDVISAGLPLEYHAVDGANDDDNEFWAVPTLYVTLHENVQWWIWGQVIKYLTDDVDNAYGAGSEIIVTF